MIVRSVVIVVAALGLVSCSAPGYGEGRVTEDGSLSFAEDDGDIGVIYLPGGVGHRCHLGRAIYSSSSGGVAVVLDASECALTAPAAAQ